MTAALGKRHSIVRTCRVLAAAAAVSATACDHSPTSVQPTATSLIVRQGARQVALAGTPLALPIILEVDDQFGNPMPGVGLAVSVSGGAIVDSDTTGFDGLVTLAWTLGTALGSETLVAGIIGAPAIAPDTVVATANAAAPARLLIVVGDGQVAPAGSTLATPLTVQVEDAYGNPVAGVLVTFTDSGHGALTAATITTDGHGDAEDVLTLPVGAGEDDVTVTATFASGPATVVFHEHGT